MVRLSACISFRTGKWCASRWRPSLSNDATRIIDAILDRAAKHSIYRQHIISPVFQRQVKSSFRDDEGNTGFDLQFEPDPQVTDEKIILDENVARVVERTVIDFHEQRTELMEFGLPDGAASCFMVRPERQRTPANILRTGCRPRRQ